MNAEGQLDTDEDGEEEAEGIPEAVVGTDDHDRAEGAVAQIVEDLGQQLVEDLVLRYNKVDESSNNIRDNDTEEEDRPNNEGGVEDRALQEEVNPLERNIIQGIHPAFAPMAPPPAPILLRRASTSSLDESSQRTSCKTSNDLYTDPIGVGGAIGHRPSYQNPNNPGRVLEKLRELRNNNELCDVTLVAGGHEVTTFKT